VLIGHGMTFTIGRGQDIVSSQGSTLYTYIPVVVVLLSIFRERITDHCLSLTIGMSCDPRGGWTLGWTGAREPF
jgi:hypothetical protein